MPNQPSLITYQGCQWHKLDRENDKGDFLKEIFEPDLWGSSQELLPEKSRVGNLCLLVLSHKTSGNVSDGL